MTAVRISTHAHHFAIAIGAQVSYKAHDEPDAWSIRRIRTRTVNDVCVMQRHLTGLQNDVNCLRLIDVHSQTFAALVQHIRILHVVVFEDSLFVRTGNHTHASIRRLAHCQRNPG